MMFVSERSTWPREKAIKPLDKVAFQDATQGIARSQKIFFRGAVRARPQKSALPLCR
jgi:hypothetical protein